MKQLRKNLTYVSVLSFSLIFVNCGGEAQDQNLSNNAPVEDESVNQEPEEINPEELVVMVTLDSERKNFYATQDEDPVFNQKMFDKAEPFVDGFARVGKKIDDSTMLFTFIDAEGEELFDYKYDAAGNFSDGMAWVEKDGKYGYINTEGEEIIPVEYLNNWNFNSGRVLFSNEEFNPYMDISYSTAKYGYLNKEGDTVIPLQYKWALSFNGGLAPVYEGGKMMFIDPEGNQAIDKKFDNADEFRKGIAPVMSGGNLGFINEEGEFIVSPKYDEYKYLYEYDVFNYSTRDDDKDRSKVYQTDEGYFIVSKNGKWGAIDIDENAIVPFEFAGIGIPDSNIVEINKVKKQEQYSTKYYTGLFDLNKKEVVLPAKYDDVRKFHDKGNVSWYKIGLKTDPEGYSTDKHGFFNAETGKIIEPEFYDVEIFHEGLAEVQKEKDGLWGYVNEDGEVVIDFQFKSGGEFEDGKAFVNTGSDYIYIDKKGNEVK
tara:strand:+ start:38002 stop:39453 length:1452 start_codon:yes stop_codon:yes gene_type:complete